MSEWPRPLPVPKLMDLVWAVIIASVLIAGDFLFVDYLWS